MEMFSAQLRLLSHMELKVLPLNFSGFCLKLILSLVHFDALLINGWKLLM